MHSTEIISLVFLSNVVAFETDSDNLNVNVGQNLRKSAFVDGDFIIGALLPIHSSPTNDTNTFDCGPIERSEGVELVEAALFAIDSINNDKKFLPGIKLGINIKDDCENERVALYQTMHLISKPKFKNETINSFSNTDCTNDYKRSPLIGMIGTVTKLNMLHYENLLKLFRIPQIGYSTALSELISPYYYLSVVPSDYHLAYLIIKILKKFDWNYISVAYTDEYFGMNGKYFLELHVSNYNICIANSIHIPRKKQDEDSIIRYLQPVNKLFQNDKAKVIVCFCDESTLKEIFFKMEQLNLTGQYFVINSNEWPLSEESLYEQETQAEGMLMLTMRDNPVPDFEKYISTLRFKYNKRNPWFDEYFDRNVNTTLNSKNAKIAYVIKSIYTFARGLQKMSREVCGSAGSQCLINKTFDTVRYMKYLSNLSFPFNGEDVEFSFYGSPPIGKFDIYNFQKTRDRFQFVKIGVYDCHHENFTDDNFSQHLNFFQNIKYPAGVKTNSKCSEQCGPGYVQVNDKESLCCWQCVPCEETEYLMDKFNCTKCEDGYLPNKNKTACIPAPNKYLKWNDPSALVAIGTSSCTITLAIMTAELFIRNRHTPVVRSSSATLHYIMLCGVIILSSSNFTLMIKPTNVTCILAKILPTLAISLIYIPVIFKTLQIFYLLKAMKNRDPKFPSVINSFRSQVIIIIVVVSLELIIFIGWIVFQEKIIFEQTYQKEPETVVHLKCKFKKKHWFDIVFLAVHLFMIYYAIKIRKISHNFHEAKFFACFTFVQTITNVTFRIVYNSSDTQIFSMFMGFSLDSFVTLLFIFFPKLYIIIWRPHMNTDDNFKSFIAHYNSYQ